MLLCRGDWICPCFLTAKPPPTEKGRGHCEQNSSRRATNRKTEKERQVAEWTGGGGGGGGRGAESYDRKKAWSSIQ